MAIAAMAFVSHHSATAQVVFSESFEAPVVSGYVVNTAPSGGKWIASAVDYGTTWRGLYRPNVQWPTPAPFSTPFGEQAYFCNYQNSGLTTAVGATGQTLTAGVRYQVTCEQIRRWQALQPRQGRDPVISSTRWLHGFNSHHRIRSIHPS